MTIETSITIKISPQTLQRLIKEHALHVTDLSCTDEQSKRVIRDSFLRSAIAAKKVFRRC